MCGLHTIKNREKKNNNKKNKGIEFGDLDKRVSFYKRESLNREIKFDIF